MVEMIGWLKLQQNNAPVFSNITRLFSNVDLFQLVL